MERGRGGREGEREREAGREGGARAKPGDQLVKYMVKCDQPGREQWLQPTAVLQKQT